MFAALKRMVDKFFTMADKEVGAIEELHGDARAAVQRMGAKDPGLEQFLADAHGYAVFPSVGRASAVIGGAFGKGEVLKGGRVVGYAGVAQLTLGVQLGGHTFSEIIAFQDKAAFDRLKQGRYAFAANASAVLVRAGAASSANYQKGVAVFVSSEGGMLLELAIGGQKFFFRPAVLGRTKKAPARKTKSPAARRTSGSRSSSAGKRSSNAGSSEKRSKVKATSRR